MFKVTTTINANYLAVWKKVKTKDLFMYVMKPLAKFSIINDDGKASLGRRVCGL